MKTLIIILFSSLMTSCATSKPPIAGSDKISHARSLFAAGELYKARKLTEQILISQPENIQAQNLMAQILEKEIARQKEVLVEKSPEEFSSSERAEEVQTWLERSRSLYDLGQYDQSLEAAEKVFLYDSDSKEASEWIDKIRETALMEGKKDLVFRKKMIQEDIRERIENYRVQARAAMQSGQWQTARFAVNKILLLEPEDPQALKWQSALDKNDSSGKGPREKGKAL